jgi:hypothetical protein
MSTPRDLREHILDLLWSQWRELGVSGTVPRRHTDDCIDPEPLIAFTATHSDLDPRLRDESIDWVLGYGDYVSRARLKNILSSWGEFDDTRFLEYAATVNAHGRAGWPAGRAKALPFQSRSRSLLEDLTSPALLSLRIRATFGVGARAELIRALLTRAHPAALTASDLSEETSYGKRNVLSELEPLRFAGVVKSFRAGNADRYSLAKDAQVRALVGPVPPRATRWTQAFGAVHLILGVAQSSGRRSDLQRAVDAVRLFTEHGQRFQAASMYPPTLPAGPAAWGRFLDWAVDQAESLARS